MYSRLSKSVQSVTACWARVRSVLVLRRWYGRPLCSISFGWSRGCGVGDALIGSGRGSHRLPFFSREALSEMHGYGSAPTGSQSAPNHFMAQALGETHTSESRLPPAPTAPNPAPTSFEGSLKRNAWLWAPPRLLFILLNKRRGDPVRLTICPFWGPF